MNAPSEAEVVAQWGGRTDPVVSICCTTFNRAPFVAAALESFLAQRTTFPFEIIIHDDASTDGTSQIIQDYARRFPALVKPIIQAQNQFSLGRKPMLEFVFPLAAGEYISICEADDFWVRSDKLQLQKEAMDRNREVDLSFHPAKFLRNDEQTEIGCWNGSEERILPLQEVIFGGGQFMPTPSLMFRSAVVKALPRWLIEAPVGDYFLQMLGSHSGVLYLPGVFSCYRVGAPGSWTERQRCWNERQILSFALKMNSALEQMKLHFPKEAEALHKMQVRQTVDASLLLFNRGAYDKSREMLEEAKKMGGLPDWRFQYYYHLRKWPLATAAARAILRQLRARTGRT